MTITRNGTRRTAARSNANYEIFELKINMQSETCVQLVEFYMYQLAYSDGHTCVELVELYMYQLLHIDGHTCVELVEFYMYTCMTIIMR
jgi:hypothetical protein